MMSQATQTYSFGVKNESAAPIEVTLDIGASENLVASVKGTAVKKVVKPGEMQFMMHAQAGVGNF